jgi:hypothetical protein
MKGFKFGMHFVFVGLLTFIAVSGIQECFINNSYGSMQAIFAYIFFGAFCFVLIVYSLVAWVLNLETKDETY